MGLKETFKKQGGMNLIKQYARAGCLGTAIGEFLLLGKSRTGLEILRLSTQLKTKQRLEKKYGNILEEFDKTYDSSLIHNSSNRVWICWFQGIENAPEIVKKCYESIKKNLSDREIVLITKKNMYEFVEFPNDIQEKINQGIITGAHLSDLLRLELLIRYGGTWIDATVYCSQSEIPNYMLNSELFMFQCLKPGRDGHTTTVSNWFITARSNNRILMATRELMREYWRRNKELIDYYIFHDMFQIVIEKYMKEWGEVVPVSNSTPHIILLKLNEKYDEVIWKAITESTPFHKLSYKIKEKRAINTYLDHILNEK